MHTCLTQHAFCFFLFNISEIKFKPKVYSKQDKEKYKKAHHKLTKHKESTLQIKKRSTHKAIQKTQVDYKRSSCFLGLEPLNIVWNWRRPTRRCHWIPSARVPASLQSFDQAMGERADLEVMKDRNLLSLSILSLETIRKIGHGMSQTAVKDVTNKISLSSYAGYSPPGAHPLHRKGVGKVHDLILPILTKV